MVDHVMDAPKNAIPKSAVRFSLGCRFRRKEVSPSYICELAELALMRITVRCDGLHLRQLDEECGGQEVPNAEW